LGDILHFKNLKKASFRRTLSELMKEAQRMQKEKERVVGEKLLLADFDELEKMIEKRISGVLITENHLESDFFLCGKYIAKTISSTVKDPLPSFYAIDYLSQVEDMNDYLSWQRAGDVCFLICTVFIGRAHRRTMTLKDYSLLGRNFYHTFYGISGKEIGYLMSAKYDTMSLITRKALEV